MTHADVIGKIQKLRAKAEGGTTQEEADALVLKAQELMRKYSIEEAMLQASGARPREEVTESIIEWTMNVEPWKGGLLNVIALHNNVRVIIKGSKVKFTEGEYAGKTGMRYELIGFPSDIEYVQMLFSALWIHLMAEAGRRYKVRPDKSITRTIFWNNFTRGYSMSIDLRLMAINRKVEGEAEGTTPGASIALRDRGIVVDEYLAKKYPLLGRSKAGNKSRYDGSARAAGGEAGSKADLSLGKRAGGVSSGRRALPPSR